MKNRLSLLFFSASFLTACSTHKTGVVKIMPVGNSITAGEHYSLPPLKERAGYRKPLYEMLKAEGYSIDFVGSTPHGRGVSADNWYDWNSESYPGQDIKTISASVLKNLPIYKPAILLVHVGTNGMNWDEKPQELSDFLNGVERYAKASNHEITIFLALILNFFEGNNRDVSSFNRQVRELVERRTDKAIKIVLVDMEKGAGMDYSDNAPNPATGFSGGDMWGRAHPKIPMDRTHPNENGHQKMARKWFNEITPYLNRIEN